LAHWNGSTWSQAALPVAASPYADGLPYILVSMYARGPYVWAVGSQPYTYDHGFEQSTTALIVEYNGSHWEFDRIALSPANPNEASTLESVDGLSASALYAGGGYAKGSLIENWSSSSFHWNSFPAPSFKNDAIITGLTVRNPAAAWALLTLNAFSPGIGADALAAWNGSSWQLQSVPFSGPGANVTRLYDLKQNATWGFTWLVGDVPESDTLYRGAIARYQEMPKEWDNLYAPQLPGYYPHLFSVSPIASTDEAWTVGLEQPSSLHLGQSSGAPSLNLTEMFLCT